MKMTYKEETVFVALVDEAGLTNDQAKDIIKKMKKNGIAITIENACGYIFWEYCNMKG